MLTAQHVMISNENNILQRVRALTSVALIFNVLATLENANIEGVSFHTDGVVVAAPIVAVARLRAVHHPIVPSRRVCIDKRYRFRLHFTIFAHSRVISSQDPTL